MPEEEDKLDGLGAFILMDSRHVREKLKKDPKCSGVMGVVSGRQPSAQSVDAVC